MLLDIPEQDKNFDGTISEHASLNFNKWCDMKIKCDECDLELTSPFSLEKHNKLNHGGNDLKKYSCNLCAPSTEVSFYDKFLNHCLSSHHENLKFW